MQRIFKCGYIKKYQTLAMPRNELNILRVCLVVAVPSVCLSAKQLKNF